MDVSIEDIDDSTIDDATRSIDELRLLRAAIFNDTSDGKLTKKDKLPSGTGKNVALRGKLWPRRQ